jgi:hypothetical protein
MVDPAGRGGLGVFHWVAYGIKPDVTSFAEGEVSKESPKYVGGKSTQGVGYYSGPCTPPGSPHHYTFLITATDLEPTELPPGLTLPELQAKLNGKTKGAAGLVGLFVKPQWAVFSCLAVVRGSQRRPVESQPHPSRVTASPNRTAGAARPWAETVK